MLTELKFIKGQKQGAKRLDGELNEIRGNSRMYKVRIHDPYFAIFVRFSPLLLATFRHLILHGLSFIDVVLVNTASKKGYAREELFVKQFDQNIKFNYCCFDRVGTGSVQWDVKIHKNH